jgi:hypothetical protein
LRKVPVLTWLRAAYLDEAAMHVSHETIYESYLHGHSGFRARVLVIQAARGGYGRAALISDTVLPVYPGDRAIRLSRAGRLRTHGPAGSGGRLSVIMQPR